MVNDLCVYELSHGPTSGHTLAATREMRYRYLLGVKRGCRTNRRRGSPSPTSGINRLLSGQLTASFWETDLGTKPRETA